MRLMTSALALALLPVTCPAFEPVTKCRIDVADDNFGRVITDIEITSPDRCPYRIATGRTAYQTFAGRMTGDGSNVTTSESATAEVYVGVTDEPASDFSVHAFQGSPPQSTPSIRYLAGQGSGTSALAGEDTGRLKVTLRYGGHSLGFSHLTFSYSPYPSIRTANRVPPGSVLIESVVLNARSPVTYKWYQGSSRLAHTGPSFMKTLHSGTYTFKVIARDADGDTGYVSKTIIVADSDRR